MEQREQKPNLFGLCRVAREEGEANHEFYKYYDVATLPNGYLLEIRPNVFSHYNGIVRIGDTDIILSTLWSRIPFEDAYFTEEVTSEFRRILT